MVLRAVDLHGARVELGRNLPAERARLLERVRDVERHEDVNPMAAGRFRERIEAASGQELAQHDGRFRYLDQARARTWIEVEDRDHRVLTVAAAAEVRVELDRAEVG